MLQNGEKATPVIPELRRQRQEHSLKFKAKLKYIASSRSASCTHQDPVSKLGVNRDLKTLLQRESTEACLPVTLIYNYISNSPSPVTTTWLAEFFHWTWSCDHQHFIFLCAQWYCINSGGDSLGYFYLEKYHLSTFIVYSLGFGGVKRKVTSSRSMLGRESVLISHANRVKTTLQWGEETES